MVGKGRNLEVRGAIKVYGHVTSTHGLFSCSELSCEVVKSHDSTTTHPPSHHQSTRLLIMHRGSKTPSIAAPPLAPTGYNAA